jgi:hypothetical protein
MAILRGLWGDWLKLRETITHPCLREEGANRRLYKGCAEKLRLIDLLAM